LDTGLLKLLKVKKEKKKKRIQFFSIFLFKNFFVCFFLKKSCFNLTIFNEILLFGM